jgi:SAM-dependent methyltransferase
MPAYKNILFAMYRTFMRFVGSHFDHRYLDPKVPFSNLSSHRNHLQTLAGMGNVDGKRILEIGSREVTGHSVAREIFAKAQYIGFDYYPGANVDVVGDAHKLSDYFENESFDIIYSRACFEHFAMPWIVAEEMIKTLKPGGILFVETHFSYSSHERPWHFFQFSDMGLRVLFPEAFGIECLEAGVSNPMIGRFSRLADEYLRYQPIAGLYCHSEFLGRKIRTVDTFDWRNLALPELVQGTQYPPPADSAPPQQLRQTSQHDC